MIITSLYFYETGAYFEVISNTSQARHTEQFVINFVNIYDTITEIYLKKINTSHLIFELQVTVL